MREAKKVQKNIKKEMGWEQKWLDGKELIMRVTKRLKETEESVEVLKAKLQSSNAIIGAVAAEYMRYHNDNMNELINLDKVHISKALVKEIVEKYQVTAIETEDKLGFEIEVKVKEVEADVQEQEQVQ